MTLSKVVREVLTKAEAHENEGVLMTVIPAKKEVEDHARKAMILANEGVAHGNGEVRIAEEVLGNIYYSLPEATTRD